jgi:hydrogenase maturation protease
MAVYVILVIGYGNSLRQDDGAGIQLANLLVQACHNAALPAELLLTHQLTPELALDIAQSHVKTVTFADTRIAHSSSDSQVRITPLPVAEYADPVGHHLNPATLLVYAQGLYSCQPEAWLATVPGTCFGHGEILSAHTRNALLNASRVIQPWLERVAA